MKEFASTKQTAEHKSANFFAGDRTEESKPVYAAAPFRLPVQRKASCACGGGCSSCQTKNSGFSVSHPNDAAEIEADQIADKVMRMTGDQTAPVKHRQSSPVGIHRKCGQCDEEDIVQRKEANNAAGQSSGRTSSLVNAAIGSGGQALDGVTRAFFEPRFGHDFSGVRIHTDDRAAGSAQNLSALAYTWDNNIVFNRGQYQPETSFGKRLLAHELAHVVQRNENSVPSRKIQRFCLNDAAACAVTCGQPGVFVSAGEAEVAPARQARDVQIRDTPVVAQASGHSRRAVNLETIARNAGLMPHTGVGGLFVDLDMSASWGAYKQVCSSFGHWATPYTGPATDLCIFVSDTNEVAAGQYLTDPAVSTLNGRSRDDWHLYIIRKITHEMQHVVSDSSSHRDMPGAACTRSTALYTDSTNRAYQLSYFLGEMSSIISEFLPVYSAVDRARPPHFVRSVTDPAQLAALHRRRYEEMMADAIHRFDFSVENCGESLRGILRAIRCHCNCLESEFYIRDTFEFTASAWPQYVKNFFNDMLRRDQFSQASTHTVDRLNWPLVRNPECYAECETRFSECTGTSRTGGMMCIAQRGTCINGCGP